MEPVKQSSFEYFVSMAFGSDELTPYTAQYSWNSNQMAHAMMGFCIAICWLFFVISLRPGPDRVPKSDETAVIQKAPSIFQGILGWLQRRPMWLYVVLLFALIPIKEAVDLMLDAGNYSGSPVQANMPRLLFDSLTDISYWWTGMFFAAALCGWFLEDERVLRGGVPTVGLILCIAFWWFFAKNVWQNQKQTFDTSGMPFNYVRLAVQSGKDVIPFAGDKAAKWKELEAFRVGIVDAPLDGRPPQTHFVIYGGRPEDRSKLAVGMGCEYAFKLRGREKYANDTESIRVLYNTATVLLERPFTLERGTLKLLECVVIDDLDVATSRPSLVDPKTRIQWYKTAVQSLPGKEIEVEKTLIEKLDPKFLPPDLVSRDAASSQIKLRQDQLELITKEVEKTEKRTAKSIMDERLEQIRELGKRAKEGQVSTIWVLAGYTGPKDSVAYNAWVQRREDWIQEIAVTLGEAKDSIRRIELTEPPPPATGK